MEDYLANVREAEAEGLNGEAQGGSQQQQPTQPVVLHPYEAAFVSTCRGLRADNANFVAWETGSSDSEGSDDSSSFEGGGEAGAEGQHGFAQMRGDQGGDFPFILNFNRPDKGLKGNHRGSGAANGKPRKKSYARGAQGGKLLPGEKQKLRREKITAKRAYRAAGRGFDVWYLAERLRGFVEREEDVMALDPAGKHGQELALRMARVLGLKAGVQGGGSGSKKGFVVVARTTHTRQLDEQTIQQLKRLAEEEVQRQSKGAVFASPAGAIANGAPSGTGHRQAGGGAYGRRRRGYQEEEDEGLRLRPVMFVSSHTLNDPMPGEGVLIVPAPTAATPVAEGMEGVVAVPMLAAVAGLESATDVPPSAAAAAAAGEGTDGALAGALSVQLAAAAMGSVGLGDAMEDEGGGPAARLSVAPVAAAALAGEGQGGREQAAGTSAGLEAAEREDKGPATGTAGVAMEAVAAAATSASWPPPPPLPPPPPRPPASLAPSFPSPSASLRGPVARSATAASDATAAAAAEPAAAPAPSYLISEDALLSFIRLSYPQNSFFQPANTRHLRFLHHQDGLWFNQNQVCVPSRPPHLRCAILSSLHERAGHPDVQGTMDAVAARFWWPGMFKAVQAHVAACGVCSGGSGMAAGGAPVPGSSGAMEEEDGLEEDAGAWEQEAREEREEASPKSQEWGRREWGGGRGGRAGEEAAAGRADFTDQGPSCAQEDSEEDGEAEEEEEVVEEERHVGLGFVQDSHGYKYHRVDIGLDRPGLGLGLGSGLGMGGTPGGADEMSVSPALAGLGLGVHGGAGEEEADPVAALEAALRRLRGPEPLGRQQQQEGQGHGGGRTERQPQQQRVDGSFAGGYRGDKGRGGRAEARGGAGRESAAAMRERFLGVHGGGAAGGSATEHLLVVNRTAKQSKQASKKQAKDARRAQRQQQDDPSAGNPGASAAFFLGRTGEEGEEGAGAAALPMVTEPGPASLSLGFAGFERYGNGIGSRLMARMGWVEGAGLGRQRQGRAEPVQASRRPKNLGLGAGEQT